MGHDIVTGYSYMDSKKKTITEKNFIGTKNMTNQKKFVNRII